LKGKKSANYLVSGRWSGLGYDEAHKYATIKSVYTYQDEATKYTYLPEVE